MQSRRLVWLAVTLTLALASIPGVGAEDQVVAIRTGTLIDGTGGPPIPGAIVLVKGARIAEVGPDVAIPKDARVIDLRPLTVLPGLIDAHTHITAEGGGERGLDRFVATAGDYAIVGANNARRMLMAGFTTIRDVGGTDLADLAVKRAVERGAIPGPRLFVSLTMISMTGGHGDSSIGLNPRISLGSLSGVANGVDAVRAMVRENFKNGADLIKYGATGGGLDRGVKPNAQQYTDEEMQAIVDEAHRLGLKVAAHAHGTEGIMAAIRAGTDSIEHGIHLDEEECRLMIERGTYLVPTLWITDAYFERYKSWGIPEYAHKKISAFIPLALENVERAIRMGVKIAVGTDAGVGEHALSAKEFTALVKHGMKPMDAIVAGTSGAAKLIGQYDQFGSVEPGKFADLVAVAGDPLQTIQVLEQVQFVMKEGRVYREKQ